MKKSLLAAIVALGSVAALNATTWRINPSPYAKAHFKNVAEAMNNINVLSGDTLLLDGGLHASIDITARKNMTIIGTGYFLDKNTNWTETQASVIPSVTLSDGSKIEGCDVTGTITGKKECTISRCKANQINSGEQTLVERCFMYNLYLYKQAIAKNNIIDGGDSYYGPVSGSSGVVFENNTVFDNNTSSYSTNYYMMSDFTNSYIRNNIIINAQVGFDSNQKPNSVYIFKSSCSNNVVQNNVFSTPAQYADPTMPNNYYVGATMENTFVNEGSDDAKWQLLPNSAAKGTATHGGDCGAFSGATPYVLSGIPMLLPHITEALVPAKPTDGKITVKLKIENQNE